MADRHTTVIELSALREEELPSLMGALNRQAHFDERWVEAFLIAAAAVEGTVCSR